jgi:hypothetical protein
MPEPSKIEVCLVPKPCEARVIEWLSDVEDFICTEAYSQSATD